MNTNTDEPSPGFPKKKMPLKRVTPDINADDTKLILKHLSNIETLNAQSYSANLLAEGNNEVKPNRVFESTDELSSISEMSAAYRRAERLSPSACGKHSTVQTKRARHMKLELKRRRTMVQVKFEMGHIGPWEKSSPKKQKKTSEKTHI
ncbi:hypothetical protein EVAR_70843_1 [Eumeta japonica]|uniref:Uncharacterized protein n=1 Tax=Eumeta variegata TaxID=151549 RepID=A0A4C1SY86_EUMVA|nr:hypothetical protein EVAR_70843_1 [Eumeta japonica]